MAGKIGSGDRPDPPTTGVLPDVDLSTLAVPHTMAALGSALPWSTRARGVPAIHSDVLDITEATADRSLAALGGRLSS